MTYSNCYNFVPLKEQKHCHQKRFLASKYPQNAFAAGAPLGELTALSRLLTLISGKEREREMREEKGKGKGGREEPQTKSLATALSVMYS